MKDRTIAHSDVDSIIQGLSKWTGWSGFCQTNSLLKPYVDLVSLNFTVAELGHQMELAGLE